MTSGRQTGRATVSFAFAAVSVAVFSSAFVRSEPAPYDVLILTVGSAAFLTGLVRLQGWLFAPYLSLFTFAIANFVPMIGLRDDQFAVAVAQSLLTVYLVLTWVFFSSLIRQYGERAFSTIMNAYAVAGTISAVLGIAGVLRLTASASFFAWEGSRAVGLFKDPNVFGPFLVPVCVYALYRILNAAGLARWIWFFALGTCVLGVVLSFSRAAWVALVIALAVFVLFPGSLRLRQKLRVAVLTLIVGTFAIVLAQQNGQVSRLLSGRAGLQQYDNERFATQSAAFEIALANPFGIGGKQTDQIFGLPPHNLYITTAAEYGWFGFLGLIGMMLLSLSNAVRGALFDAPSRRSLHTIVVASLVGTMVGVVTIDPLHWRHFWILLALAWLPVSTVAAPASSRGLLGPRRDQRLIQMRRSRPAD